MSVCAVVYISVKSNFPAGAIGFLVVDEIKKKKSHDSKFTQNFNISIFKNDSSIVPCNIAFTEMKYTASQMFLNT